MLTRQMMNKLNQQVEEVDQFLRDFRNNDRL
jgi:hypothetical protein